MRMRSELIGRGRARERQRRRSELAGEHGRVSRPSRCCARRFDHNQCEGILTSFYCTVEMQFGYQANDKIGRKVAILMPEPYRGQDGGCVDRCCVTGEQRFTAVRAVASGQRAGGATFPVECYVGELRSGEGRLFGGYIRGLTERQRLWNRWQGLQEKLLCADPPNLAGESASSVVHDHDRPSTAAPRSMEANARRAEREDFDWRSLREVVDRVIEVLAGGGVELSENLNNRRFHPFVTAKGDDMGLGLTISRPIAEVSGVRHAASPNPSRGVTFQFELPTEMAAD